MCAILIVGVALAGLTEGITTALVSCKESELQATAAHAAAGQIELLRADKILTDGETEGECGDDLPLYHWKQTVGQTDIDGLHEVTVTILQAKSDKEIFELKTMLFDPDYIGQDGLAADSKSAEKARQKDMDKGRRRQ
jgi:hypothetical protein